MISKHVKIFLKYYRAGDFLGSLSFKWNRALRILQPLSDHGYIRRVKLLYLLHNGITALVLLQILVGAISGSYSTTEKIAQGISALVLLITAVYIRFSSAEASIIVAYLNNVLNFERRYLLGNGGARRAFHRKLNFIEKLNMVTLYFSYYLSQVTGMGLVYSYHWGDPCKPSLGGYWLLSECRQGHEGGGFRGSPWDVALKLAVLMANQWAIDFGIKSGGVILSGVQILSTQSLKTCILK